MQKSLTGDLLEACSARRAAYPWVGGVLLEEQVALASVDGYLERSQDSDAVFVGASELWSEPDNAAGKAYLGEE